eukprot:2138612-Prymnesium_polylepis.1
MPSAANLRPVHVAQCVGIVLCEEAVGKHARCVPHTPQRRQRAPDRCHQLACVRRLGHVAPLDDHSCRTAPAEPLASLR